MFLPAFYLCVASCRRSAGGFNLKMKMCPEIQYFNPQTKCDYELLKTRIPSLSTNETPLFPGVLLCGSVWESVGECGRVWESVGRREFQECGGRGTAYRSQNKGHVGAKVWKHSSERTSLLELGVGPGMMLQ